MHQKVASKPCCHSDGDVSDALMDDAAFVDMDSLKLGEYLCIWPSKQGGKICFTRVVRGTPIEFF